MARVRMVADQAVGAWRVGLWRLAANTLAGAHPVPGAARALMLRALGVDCRTMWLSAGIEITHRRLTIGPGAFVNEGVLLDCAGGITIGAGTLIGPRTCILTSTHPVQGGVPGPTDTSPVIIGERAWIGGHATILPGVTIGDDVIVGAGAVVTRSLLRPGVYVGVPAQFARELTDEERATTALPTEGRE